MKNGLKTSIAILVMLVAVMQGVAAFGVTAFFWEPDRPLALVPGQSKDISLQLQNMVGGEDVTVMAEIAEGGDIAVISDEDNIYKVPFGRKDVKINLRVTIPETTDIGGSHKITVAVSDIGEGEGGMMDFGSAIMTTVPVVVRAVAPEEPVAEPAPEQPSLFVPFLIGGILLVLVLVVVVAVFVFKKKWKKR